MNRLKALEQYGQSIWLDYIRRELLKSGELKKLIDEDGLDGMTSNPSIFEKAIVQSEDYAETLKELFKRNLTTKAIYEEIAISDVQTAADILFSVYEKTQKQDGYVSLEVSPTLANDTQGTIEEAKRLWQKVNKPNIMIKVPGTAAGIPAIRELIAEGININVTLLFSVDSYLNAANAYLEGLEHRLQSGKKIDHIASVASFFVSRIDTLVDEMIDKKLKSSKESYGDLEKIKGKVAIANAKIAYHHYKEIKASPRFLELKKHFAQNQRVLWASTSTKNPKYSDVLYVEQLIGPETVNTMPPETMIAFRNHGNAAPTLEKDLNGSYEIMDVLEKNGIALKDVTEQLLLKGVKLFSDDFEKLLNGIEQKKSAIQLNEFTKTVQNDVQFSVATAAPAIMEALNQWQKEDKIKRLWAGDPSIWSNTDEAKWLGWLTVIDSEFNDLPKLDAFANQIKSNFKHVVVLGMGGSSLCPDMIAKIFGKMDDYPLLHVLDSTDPLQIKHLEEKLDLKKTLFIVSSKSGTTLEPNIFERYFYARLQAKLNTKNVGDHFLAITDPNTKLETLAKEKQFKAVFYGVPSIGGRYSALSNFGMIPARLMGLDVKVFLQYAKEMANRCSKDVQPKDNIGVILGIILGVCAKQGKDKVTLVVSPEIQNLGAWLEQLIAESTGKEGKGLIPVDEEALGDAKNYDSDRVFIYIRLTDAFDDEQDDKVNALEKANFVVIRIPLEEKIQLGKMLFLFEMAIAVASSIISINPFNQPDVEEAKNLALQFTNEYEKTGKMHQSEPFYSENEIRLFSDENNVQAIQKALEGTPSIENYLKAHFSRIKQNDYVNFSAFIEMSPENSNLLEKSRILIRNAKKVATCLGFGPRFLHSTGQAYKGGPNTGVFLQITHDHPKDLEVPETKYTFGQVIHAQAQADFEVLAKQKRRALRIHFGKDINAGLKQLHTFLNNIVGKTSTGKEKK